MKVEVGTKLIVRKVGNAARYLQRQGASIDDYLSEATVSKVGRKFFYLEGYDCDKFEIGTMHQVSEYASTYVLYESRQEVYDEIEAMKISKEIYEKDIMEIVWLLVLFFRYKSAMSLAKAYVKTAEFCAKRGIEPEEDLWGSVGPGVTGLIHHVTVLPKNRISPEAWAFAAFQAIQSLADGANLDLVKAVEEVMRDRA